MSQQDLATAVAMIQRGIPVFVAKPDSSQRDGFRKPSGWQRTPASFDTLKDYQEGDALCMVCGQGLDVIDTDVQHDGMPSREGLATAGLMPVVYGVARTPSGGTHEFIASLGIRKSQAAWQGIDIQSGAPNGESRGFVYIAPTIKRSKITKMPEPYVWEQPIDWDLYDAEHETDTSGEELAAVVRREQSTAPEWKPYEGPTYSEFSSSDKYYSDRYVEGAVRGIALDLQNAKALKPGERNAHGVGWEKITADAAFRLCQLAMAPWADFAPDRALQVLRANAPTDDDWTLHDVEQKFRSQARLAERKPLPKPAWSGYIGSPDDAVPPPASEEVQRDFWDRRQYLQIIRDFSYARIASPWAVLGVVMCRALCTVPPWVMLPPVIGVPASLNLYVAIVGPPGSGKDVAMGVGAEVFPGPVGADEIVVEQPGSGEGIGHLFKERAVKDDPGLGIKKGDLVPIRDTVLFSVPEVDTLVALGMRSGSVLLPSLRDAWFGSKLSFAYASKDKRLEIEPQSYRLCMQVGVQPIKAKAVLDDVTGGLPQRFVWMPAVDPGIPDDDIPAPPPLPYLPRTTWSGSRLDQQIEVPEFVRQLCRDQKRKQGKGKLHVDPLDTHSLLARLKVAFALALLDHRATVDEDDWTLAGIFMAKSNETRAGVLEAIKFEAEKEAARRGRSAGKQQAAAEEEVDKARMGRVTRRILTMLSTGEKSRSELNRGLGRAESRALLDEALQALLSSGQVILDGESGWYKAGVNV